MANSSMLNEPPGEVTVRSVVLNANGSTMVWKIESGAVDVFLVATSPACSGIRKHALRLGKGDVFTTVDVSEVEWVAIPTSGAIVVEIGQATATVQHDFEVWLHRLARLIFVAQRPSKEVQLDSGLHVLDDKEPFTGVEAMQWLSIIKGEVQVGDGAGATLVPGMVPFPFSQDTWFTCSESSTVHVSGSIRHLDVEPLTVVARLLSDRHLIDDQFELEETSKRIDARRTANRDADVDAVESFASVLHPGRRRQSSPVRSNDPLIKAIALVARDQHITFRETLDKGNGCAGGAARVVLILQEAGLLWRRVLLDDTWWTKDVGSFLAFRRSDGAVLVVQQDRRSGYTMLDPATSERIPIDANSVRLLEDRAIFLSRSFPEVPLTGKELLKFGLSGRRGDICAAVLTGLALGVISLLTPLVTSSIVGGTIPNAALDQLGQYTFLLVSMTVSAGLFLLVQAMMMVRVSGHLDSSLQGALWDRLMRLSPGFFRGYTAGDLANRAMGINTINSTITNVSLVAILNGIFASLNFILMLWYSWELSIAGIIIVIISLLVAFGLTMWQLVWQRLVMDSQGHLTGLVLQLIGGVNKLRIANAEPRAYSVWAEAYSEQNRLNLKAQGLENALTVFNTLVPTISAIILFITIAAVLGTISIGDFLAFSAAYTQFFTGVVGLTSAVGNSISLVPLYRRARPILDAELEVSAAKHSPGRLIGRVTFDHVSFEYNTKGKRTLDDICLDIAPGEFVAIVGPSGAGKSTLFRLLMGFERPSEGIVAYDNKDLETLDIQAVRQQFGVVMQNSQIMPGSVFQNITGNSPELTSDDAWEAARMAGFDEDIQDMPMGMETFITEAAATISTGQRQRLMIARALIKRPRILVLDEATSALDNRTQAIVTESLARLKVTRIVIAQRLSTIVDADRIVVIDRGRIGQVGTYAELMEIPGIFREMVSRQLT